MLAVNSLRVFFSYLGMSLFHFHYCSIYNSWCFFWKTFNGLTIPSYRLLASIVSHRKSVINLIGVPVHITSLFFYSCFHDFLFVFQRFTVMVLGTISLSLLRIIWVSWGYRLMFFIKFERFSAIISLNIFFCPFCTLLSFQYYHYAYVDALSYILHFFEALFIFLHFFSILQIA